MEDIYQILNAIYSFTKQDVLATIIRVEGSAYRKEGSSMLFRGDGTMIGMLSANCLETDLLYRVDEIREHKTSQTIVYDMKAEDDLSWGQGAGCNGLLHVLLEPVDAYLHEHLCRLKFYLDSGSKVTMIKKLTTDYSVNEYLFLADDHHLFGKWQGIVPLHVRSLLNELHQTYSKSGLKYCEELSADVYIHTFHPKPRLIIFGAGPDAIPLVKFASKVGFSVIVSDWRSHLCNDVNFPDAEQIIIGFPSEALEKLHLNQYDSVLILTHQFQRDKELLQQLKGQKLQYLGVLGSRMRTERLLDGQKIPPGIRSPVGLPIGADGPEEIAISIIAELIQLQSSKHLQRAIHS